MPTSGAASTRRWIILRQFADAGVAVLVVAAVGRVKNARGQSSYDGDGMNLASFRESSELEFGADDAFILTPDRKRKTVVNLRHLKARHTEARDVALIFDRPRQSFTPTKADELGADAEPVRRGGTNGKLRADLAALWNRTDRPPTMRRGLANETRKSTLNARIELGVAGTLRRMACRPIQLDRLSCQAGVADRPAEKFPSVGNAPACAAASPVGLPCGIALPLVESIHCCRRP